MPKNKLFIPNQRLRSYVGNKVTQMFLGMSVMDMVRGINWSKPGQFFSHEQKMVSHLTQRKNLKNIVADNPFCVDFSQYQEYSLHLTSVSSPHDYHKWGNHHGEQDIYEPSYEAGNIMNMMEITVLPPQGGSCHGRLPWPPSTHHRLWPTHNNVCSPYLHWHKWSYWRLNLTSPRCALSS